MSGCLNAKREKLKPLGTNLGTNRGISISEVLPTMAHTGRAGGI
jgi:hypothetical protein